MKPAPVATRGVLFALLAYGAWGVFPLYWKGFGGVPAAEVIAHRLLWSLAFLGGLVAFRGQLGECARVLRTPRLLGVLLLTASLLSLNWGLFVYGVNTGQIVETSLGYFINPLLTVLLGRFLLHERLTRAQVVALALAAAGVVAFGWHVGRVPWIALGLAATFGLYGLLRKTVPVGPLPGLFVETAVLAPFASLLLAGLGWHGSAHFLDSPALTLLFIGCGVVTALPLLWFVSAAKLLPLSTLGFLQYLAPTLQLLVGVLVYREPFNARGALAFVLIWCAVGIFLGFSPRRRPAA